MKLQKMFLIVTVALLSSALIHAMTLEQRRVKLARFNEMVQDIAIDKTDAGRKEWLNEFEQVKNALKIFLGVGQIQLANMKIKEFKAEPGTTMAKFKELQEDFENLDKASVKSMEIFPTLVEKLKKDGTEWDPFTTDPAKTIPFSSYVDQVIKITQDLTTLFDQHPTISPKEKDLKKKLLASFKNFVLARAVLYSMILITTTADKIKKIKIAKDGALALNKFENMYETLDEILELLRRARYESGIFDVDGNLITPDEDNVTVFNEENAFDNDIFNFKDMGRTLIDSIKTDIWQPLIDKIYQLQLAVTKDDSDQPIANVGGKTKEQLYGAVNADEIRAIDLDIAYQVGPAFLDRLDILRTLFNIPDNRQMPQPTAVGGNAQAKVTIQNFESKFNKRATAVGAPVAPVGADLKTEVITFNISLKEDLDPGKPAQPWGKFLADKINNPINFSEFSGWVDMLDLFNGKLSRPDQVNLNQLKATFNERQFQYATELLELARATLEAADNAFATPIGANQINTLQTSIQEAKEFILRVLQETDLLDKQANAPNDDLENKVVEVLDQFYAIVKEKIVDGVLGKGAAVFGPAATPADILKLEMRIISLSSIIIDQMKNFQNLFGSYYKIKGPAKDVGVLRDDIFTYAENNLIAPPAPLALLPGEQETLDALKDKNSILNFQTTLLNMGRFKDNTGWANAYIEGKLEYPLANVEKDKNKARIHIEISYRLYDETKNFYDEYKENKHIPILADQLKKAFNKAIKEYNKMRENFSKKVPAIQNNDTWAKGPIPEIK